MPTASFNGQSFTLDGRRIWIAGASVEYARVPRDLWTQRLADVRQAGFNAVATTCPWMLHEPRRGRFDFADDNDVRAFVEACAEAGLWVILRAGPFVGAGYDAGGIPGWLVDDPETVVRESSEHFLERVTRWFRRLFNELSGLQATDDGPIVLVQIEQSWLCANDEEAARYLGAVTRTVRESGVAVPLINANNLWPAGLDTIETWQGGEDMLAHVRQLRSVQPAAPRVVSALHAADVAWWGRKKSTPLDARTLQRRVAEVLAAGGQAIVEPFHGGTSFGFTAGRRPGAGTLTTSAAVGAPLGEAGHRGARYHLLRRLVTFASNFGAVFADLDPDTQPVIIDPADGGPTVVPLRGGAGRVVFIFSGRTGSRSTLLLDNGARLPIEPGDQHVGWYLLDVDLGGAGRLDFANLCPFALVDRAILVLFGPAGATGIVSINGTPLELEVPKRGRPLVATHEGITLVVCSEDLIDTTYVDEKRVHIGVTGLEVDGTPRALAGTKGWVVDRSGELETLPAAPRRSGTAPRAPKLGEWSMAPRAAYVDGSSPRYATLQGPTSLSACGATSGYGWYRIRLRASGAKKHRIHLPASGDRLHLFVDGELEGLFGIGPGAEPLPHELRLAKGDRTLTLLVENHGRLADGSDIRQPLGLDGPMYAIKNLTGVRKKIAAADPVDPFTIRRFIVGATAGVGSAEEQAVWEFSHARKVPILVDVAGTSARGTFVLNDVPLAVYTGDLGPGRLRLLLEPGATEAMRRGKNVLRFAPERGQDGAAREMQKATALSLCETDLTAGATWSFAKWETPPKSGFTAAEGDDLGRRRGIPVWWRCAFDAPRSSNPIWFDTTGLSKGVVQVNGRVLGRYFTATRTNRAVGPQVRLYVPTAWLQKTQNELLVFDEHGFGPSRTKLVHRDKGDLD